MASQPAPSAPFRGVDVNTTPSSAWDRITTWASEHKAVVYTIAGVAVVVTGAGVVYYLSDTKKQEGATGPRPSKKERRKAKKESQKGKEKDLESAEIGENAASSTVCARVRVG
jgi:mitochondrial import receptor subunit TOM70